MVTTLKVQIELPMTQKRLLVAVEEYLNLKPDETDYEDKAMAGESVIRLLILEKNNGDKELPSPTKYIPSELWKSKGMIRVHRVWMEPLCSQIYDVLSDRRDGRYKEG